MNIYIVYHSQMGTTHLLAKAIEEGVKRRTGTHVFLRRIPEVPGGFVPKIMKGLPGDISRHGEGDFTEALAEYNSIPECTPEELRHADAIILGSPVHYAGASAAVRTFLESLTPLWEEGALTNKPCGVFVTSNTMYGGRELAMASLLATLLSFSMISVGIPFQATYMYKFGSIFGPTATGEPTPENKSLAALFGERMAEVAFALEFGKKTQELKK